MSNNTLHNSLRVDNAMQVVIKITNIIRRGIRSLIHRKFRYFLSKINASFGDKLMRFDILTLIHIC